MQDNKTIKDLIALLNQEGLGFIYINDNYYHVDEIDFVKPHDKANETYIYIKGQDVTDIIINKASGAQSATKDVTQSIAQGINNRKTVIRTFSSHYSFIHYQANFE